MHDCKPINRTFLEELRPHVEGFIEFFVPERMRAHYLQRLNSRNMRRRAELRGLYVTAMTHGKEFAVSSYDEIIDILRERYGIDESERGYLLGCENEDRYDGSYTLNEFVRVTQGAGLGLERCLLFLREGELAVAFEFELAKNGVVDIFICYRRAGP